MSADRRPVAAVASLGAALTVAAVLTLPVGTASAAAPVRSAGTFETPSSGPLTAVTYRPDEVPVGAGARVEVVPISNGRTLVTLHVSGLRPRETYGAHAHYRACGQVATEAGAHYQSVQDPAVGGSESAASVDPAYANPDNEVWLDLTTNAAGNGHAWTVVDWHFRAAPARSVVLHVDPTSAGGQGLPPAGNAGARAACLTVRF